MGRCIHLCGNCKDNVTCPYFCDTPSWYRAYGSIGEMQKAMEREKTERLDRATKEAKKQ